MRRLHSSVMDVEEVVPHGGRDKAPKLGLAPSGGGIAVLPRRPRLGYVGW
jgi:hypothetical protein